MRADTQKDADIDAIRTHPFLAECVAFAQLWSLDSFERYSFVKHLSSSDLFDFLLVEKDGLLFSAKVPRAAAGGENALAMLQCEARILQCCSHPHILQIDHLARTSTSSMALITEFCDLGTLSEFVEAHGLLSLDQARFLLTQINQALFYLLEKKRMILRNITPDTVLLASDASLAPFGVSAKLADFGVSRVVGGTKTSTFVGVTSFSAPEIRRRDAYTSKCDLFSVGVLLAWMVAGPASLKTSGTTTTWCVPPECRDSFEWLDAINLVSGLLQNDEDARFNWDEYFNHPFFQ